MKIAKSPFCDEISKFSPFSSGKENPHL